MDEISKLLKDLGGPSNVAKSCGLCRSAVSQWVRRGTIPAQHALAVSGLASSLSVILTPSDILEKFTKSKDITSISTKL